MPELEDVQSDVIVIGEFLEKLIVSFEQELMEIKRAITGLQKDALVRAKDIIFLDDSHGLVLRDARNPSHYWRVTVDNFGNLLVTDLGVAPPS